MFSMLWNFKRCLDKYLGVLQKSKIKLKVTQQQTVSKYQQFCRPFLRPFWEFLTLKCQSYVAQQSRVQEYDTMAQSN